MELDKQFYQRRSDLVSLFVVILHVSSILLPLFWCATFQPSWVYVLFWLYIGFGLHGILLLIHECSHYLTFKKKEHSTWLGAYVLGPLAFTDFEYYRYRHWEHHKHLGVDGETKFAYLIDVKGMRIFYLLWRCLVLLEVLNLMRKQQGSSNEQQHSKGWLIKTAFFQLILFGSIALSAYYVGGFDWPQSLVNTLFTYVGVYMYGLMSLTVFTAALRAIVEHQQHYSTEIREGVASLRNLKANWFSRWLLGTYGFAEHYTHHKIPGIPYYQLPAATKELSKEDETLKPIKGYGQVLKDIVV